jgi:hypothetical protein
MEMEDYQKMLIQRIKDTHEERKTDSAVDVSLGVLVAAVAVLMKTVDDLQEKVRDLEMTSKKIRGVNLCVR